MTEQHDPWSADTFPRLVRSAAAVYGDDIAITLQATGTSDESITFSELDRKSAQLARGLIAHGAGKGTRIGFIHGNGPSFAVTLAAIARIGSVAIPFSTMLRGGELVRVLRQSDVAGLILQHHVLGKDCVERLCEALPELRECDPELRLSRVPFLRWIASTGDDLPRGIRSMEFLTGDADSISEALLLEIETEVHPTDQMLEIYTSGSMAQPKGVRHSHGPVMFRNRSVMAMMRRKRGEQMSVSMPMFWVGGLGMFLLASWLTGATSICTEDRPAGRRLVMGTVPAAEDLELMSKFKPYWALGMTETFGPYSYGDVVRVPGYLLCSPLDHIADRFEVRVVDQDCNPVRDGESGEIQVRGYTLTPGIHKMERDDYLTPDGYLRTGDMGRVDGERILFIGRNGDVIKTAGANVSPAEVEMEMQQIDGVHTAYVVGLPDQERGERVVAAVIARDAVVLDFAAIDAALRKRISSYKVPRAYVQIAPAELPMLPVNKLARTQLEALLAQRLALDETEQSGTGI